jgi:hypothetical protein
VKSSLSARLGRMRVSTVVLIVAFIALFWARRCGVPPGVLAGARLCTGEHCSRWMQIAVAVWLEPSWTAYGCGARKQMATLGVSR